MKTRNLYTIALVILLGNSPFAQSPKDSLLQLLSTTKADTSKVWLLHDVAKAYRMTSVDSMIVYLEEALQLSKKLDYAHGKIASLHRLSQRYQYKGEKEKERTLTLQALNLSLEKQSTAWLGQIYNHLGSIYYWELKYDSAYHAYMKAEEVFATRKEEYITWETKMYLFRLFRAQGQEDKAIAYLNEAYEMTKAKSIRMDLGWVLSKRVEYFYTKKDWENYAEASEEYLQFLSERKQSIVSNNKHKAIFAYVDDNPQKTIADIEALIPFHIKNNNHLSLVETYSYLAKLKLRIGANEEALDHYKKLIPLAQQLSYTTSEAAAYQAIYDIYESEKDLAAAYPYLKKYHQTMDSLNTTEVKNNLNELEVKYETLKKDEALAQQQLALEKAAQSRRIISIIALTGAVLAAIALWFLYFKNRTNRLLKSQNLIIEKALGEKEILLKEIHHRVKNNLQVISSLLNWQSRYIEDRKALESMQEGRNRVQSMALIHQNLYQSENLTGVEVSDYIDKLGNSLFHSYNIRNEQVRFESKVESLNLDVDTLIPLGLILNELLSNALKHAFPEGREGQISVTLEQQEERLLLEVKDDGVGIPEGQEKKTSDSFGYKLIEAFAEKLKAQLQIDNTYGTTVRLLIQNFKIV